MSERLRAVIVDDEAPARARLRRLLERVPGIVVEAEAASGDEAVDVVRERAPDVIFLDVQMPGGDGFEVLRRLRACERPLVVFVTAWEQHALRAFEVNAVDYLLKPYATARVAESCRRLAERHAHRGREAERLASLLDGLRASREGASTERFIVSSGERQEVVETGAIDWISAADNYAELHAGGRTHLLRTTLAALEEQLDPRRFTRIHRSTLVNLSRVREIHPLFSGDAEVVLERGQRLRVSRSYRAVLHQRLRGSNG